MKNTSLIIMTTLLAFLSTAHPQSGVTPSGDTTIKGNDKLSDTATSEQAVDSSASRRAFDALIPAIEKLRQARDSIKGKIKDRTGEDKDVGTTPQATVNAYFRRLSVGDYSGAQALIEGSNIGRGTVLVGRPPTNDKQTYSILKTDIKGMSADVTVFSQSSSMAKVSPVTFLVKCIKNPTGIWLISSVRQLEKP